MSKLAHRVVYPLELRLFNTVRGSPSLVSPGGGVGDGGWAATVFACIETTCGEEGSDSAAGAMYAVCATQHCSCTIVGIQLTEGSEVHASLLWRLSCVSRRNTAAARIRIAPPLAPIV